MNREHMGTGPPPATLSLPNPPSPRSSPSSMTQLSQVESQPPQAPRIGWACTLRRGPAGATRAGSILREASSAREKGSRQVNVLGQVLRSHTDPILWPKRDLGLLALPAGRVGPLAGQEPAQSKKDPWVRPHGLTPPQQGHLVRRWHAEQGGSVDRADDPGPDRPRGQDLLGHRLGCCGLVSCC